MPYYTNPWYHNSNLDGAQSGKKKNIAELKIGTSDLQEKQRFVHKVDPNLSKIGRESDNTGGGTPISKYLPMVLLVIIILICVLIYYNYSK